MRSLCGQRGGPWCSRGQDADARLVEIPCTSWNGPLAAPPPLPPYPSLSPPPPVVPAPQPHARGSRPGSCLHVETRCTSWTGPLAGPLPPLPLAVLLPLHPLAPSSNPMPLTLTFFAPSAFKVLRICCAFSYPAVASRGARDRVAA